MRKIFYTKLAIHIVQFHIHDWICYPSDIHKTYMSPTHFCECPMSRVSIVTQEVSLIKSRYCKLCQAEFESVQGDSN